MSSLGRAAKDLSRSCVDVLSVEPLGMPFKTPDPFLFCVYHKDEYPAGNKKMEAPRRGNGADFAPGPYRMYHGDRIPGFPQHPHRGFETVTASITGLVDHTDSHGNAGRYGHGDLQWMTAGGGVVHGEMFPLVNTDKPNPLRFFQIWLNLPARNKMVDPAFVMHWGCDIPHIASDDGKVDITLWAGSIQGHHAQSPPPNSWATDPLNDVAILLLTLQPGGVVTLPAAASEETNRMAYFIEGSEVAFGGQSLTKHATVTLRPSEIQVSNPSSGVTEVLILQGRPIGEPVVQHGPFVMNTQAEIQQAFSDYGRTQFGGWPWPEDAVVFPPDKPRFALLDGKEEIAPPAPSL